MRTEGTKVGAGNEVGTRMGRTMYPGSGLSVEIIPLVLPECMMYMDGLQGCTWSCVEEEEEGSSRLVSASLYVVGGCKVFDRPPAWRVTGGFYRRTRRPTIWIKGTRVGPGWLLRRLARAPQASCLVDEGPAGYVVSIAG